MTWFKDAVTGSTVVIAFATVVNLIVSAGLWISTRDSVKVTRDIFITANRPYIGAESARATKELRILSITANIKNFGSVPGNETRIDSEMRLNGNVVPQAKLPDKPITLFPTQQIQQYFAVRDLQFDAVTNGQSVLEITIRISYKGPQDEPYAYCEKGRYEPQLNAMLNLGAC